MDFDLENIRELKSGIRWMYRERRVIRWFSMRFTSPINACLLIVTI